MLATVGGSTAATSADTAAMAPNSFAQGAGTSLNAPPAINIPAIGTSAGSEVGERSLTPETAAELAAVFAATEGQAPEDVLDAGNKRKESKSSGFFSSLFGKNKKGSDRELEVSPPPGQEMPKRGSDAGQFPKRGSKEMESAQVPKRGSKEVSPAEMPEVRRKSFFGLGRSGKRTNAAAVAESSDPSDTSDPDWAVWEDTDQDYNGTVSLVELARLFESAGVTLTAEQLAEVTAAADKDSTGRLSFKEFKALLGKCRAEGLTNVLGDTKDPDLVIWQNTDRDGTGWGPPKELGLLFRSAGVVLSAVHVSALCESSDTDSSGRISFKEFKALLVRCRADGVAAAMASLTAAPSSSSSSSSSSSTLLRAARTASTSEAGEADQGTQGSEPQPAVSSGPTLQQLHLLPGQLDGAENKPAGIVPQQQQQQGAEAGATAQPARKKKVRKAKPATSAAGAAAATGTTGTLPSSPPPLTTGGVEASGGVLAAATGTKKKLVRKGSGSKVPIRTGAELTAVAGEAALPKSSEAPAADGGSVAHTTGEPSVAAGEVPLKPKPKKKPVGGGGHREHTI